MNVQNGIVSQKLGFVTQDNSFQRFATLIDRVRARISIYLKQLLFASYVPVAIICLVFQQSIRFYKDGMISAYTNLSEAEVPRSLNTSSHDIINDFFVPMLKASVQYCRGVGYFSSGWMRAAAPGMVAFAANGGKARWITSPILSKSDWEALKQGDDARSNLLLKSILERNITELADVLEKDTCSAIAWMIADDVLEFKLALPRNKLASGEFHDKFGIFEDSAGNRISFNGSYNDSIQGLRNYESLKVFTSWEPAYAEFVEDDKERFERLWANEDENVRVYSLPEAVRASIMKLRTFDRPYPKPDGVEEHPSPNKYLSLEGPSIPAQIKLRDYQVEAIEAWFENGCLGLLEMATGTGKTITALAASSNLFDCGESLAVIIAVPFKHLVDQWSKEAELFNYKPLKAYVGKSRWHDELNQAILEYNAGHRRFISVITTHDTFCSEAFQETIGRLTNKSLLIADEAHHLGAEHSRKNYPPNIPYRLALSATPDRWFDNLGTAALRKYFGSTVFNFSLEQAIGEYLTPYYYYPRLVPLTYEELEQYEDLSAKIARFWGREDIDAEETLKKLLIQRANLLNTATNKLHVLSELIDEQDDVKHALFYCAPGQIDDVQRLLGWEKGLLINRFTYEEDQTKRAELLDAFAGGDLQGLVAMKCLDEGVDVPNTRVAFFLASSSNPREFVQRRGRILRKAPEKEFSIVYDLLAAPPTFWDPSPSSPSFKAERSILRRELDRFNEFASLAINKHQALDVTWDIAKRYQLMDF